MTYIEKAKEVEKIAKTYKPGEKVPVSGQYEVTGPRGGSRGREALMFLLYSFSAFLPVYFKLRIEAFNQINGVTQNVN